MPCSPQMMKYTGYLHVIALVVTVIGTYLQIDSVQKGEVASIALSLSLMVMLLLRIPNQICVALDSKHGWYSVIGSLFGATSFAILTYFNYKAQQKAEKYKKIPYSHLEHYGGPVTLSLPEWRQYVAKGYNTLLPGVIPGGTMQTAGGQSGAVYTGHVR